MKILSMTATFGKLDNATLELDGGLNIITAPNEWGKSTWCAFLTAMLYGIDTRTRTTRDSLADKERYAPWSGKPMEGSIRLIHRGRDITIQRRTRGRVPLGEFRACETQTGLPVPELNKSNCGEYLLGVERSVFLRTGFIRLSDLPVDRDEALRRRLNALVTTGDESGSAEALAGQLRELKHKCRYNRTGLIPQAQQQLRDLEAQLRELDTLQQQTDMTESRIAGLEQRIRDLELHRSAMSYYQAQEDRQRIDQAARELERVRDCVAALEARCGENPPRGQLLADLQQAQQQLDLPDPLENARLSSRAPAALAALLAVPAAAAAVMLRRIPAAAVLLGILAVLFVFLAVRGLLRHRAQREDLLRSRQERAARIAALEESMACRKQQLALTEDLDRARRQQELLYRQLQALTAMARDAARPDRPDPLDLSREETAAQLDQARELLQRCRLQQAQHRGRMESLPQRQILAARITDTKARLEKLEETYLALDYAQKALDSALQELQRRFAPRISRLAGGFLERLTLGRYSALSIDSDLAIESAAESEITRRSPLWRSDGTADQMYLALRLAVWQTLTPDAPLVLDDAFVRFDRQRLEAALELMGQLARDHQILLFTCQTREEDYVNRTK